MTTGAGSIKQSKEYPSTWPVGVGFIIIIIVLLFVIYAWVFVSAYFTRDLEKAVTPYGIVLAGQQARPNLDFLILTVGIGIILVYLTCLPAFMLLGYREVHQDRLEKKIRQDLLLCGLGAAQLKEGLKEFRSKNSWKVFILPAGIMTAFVFIMLGSILLSHGLFGIVLTMSGECINPPECTVAMVDVSRFLFNLPRTAAPISWAFLGAYFYALAVLLRRWQRSDLTTGTLWKLTVRFAVAFVLGMLLTKIAPVNIDSVKLPLAGTGEYLDIKSLADNSAVIFCMIAFMIGIVPDEFLTWVRNKTIVFLEAKPHTFRRIFEPSDLQGSIDGLNFWQADRLNDEGIESVQDLAMVDIPDMLIKIRFDAPHLLYWVDQALLCHQAGKDWELFKQAHILTASDLLFLAGQYEELPQFIAGHNNDQKRELSRIHKSIHAAATREGSSANSDLPIEMLENILYGLLNTPNVPYVWSYMTNTRTASKRHALLDEFDKIERAESRELPDQFTDDHSEPWYREFEEGLGWQ